MQQIQYKNPILNKAYDHMSKMSMNELYKLLAYYSSIPYGEIPTYYHLCKQVIDDKLRAKFDYSLF